LSKAAYERAVEALFTQLPMFQRQGPAAYKADLSATKLVCAALDHPERTLKYVHVAGTNGKGTVCHMVAAALQQAGHRVGLFTSPHLVDFRERIRIDGECIPEEAVVDFVARWQAADGAWGTPSFFELTFGMALDHFRREACDIVVMETGMGGRLDSTNVIPTAEVCAVTNIGLDHQQFLGPDIRTIAKEKAGIFKDGVPVVLGPMRPEAQSEMLSAAMKSSSEMHYARDVESEASAHLGVEASLVKEKNLSTALAVLQVLQSAGWDLSERAIQDGLADYAHLTGQRGRWQRVDMPHAATVVLDGAHNVDGVAATVKALRELAEERGGRLTVIWGAVADKDHSKVMALLPEEATYVWCAADIPRAMPASAVSQLRPGLKGVVVDRPVKALERALMEASSEDVVWVGGSLFVVGDVLKDAPSVFAQWPA